MNRDDIIRMAEDVGMTGLSLIDVGHLERFAALVAAVEREACAKVAEDHKDDCFFGEADYYEAERIARAIRNRG